MPRRPRSGRELPRSGLSRSAGLAVAIVAGGALPLAFAPFAIFPLAPLSYAILIFLWRGASPTRAFGLGCLYGFSSFLAGLYWIYVSVHDFGLLPVPTSLLLTLALPAGLALYVGVAGWCAARWFSSDGLGAWLGAVPALWVLTEWCRGWLLTGFGWLAAGYSQTDSWLMAFAPLGGVHGITWLVLLCAGSLVAVLAGTGRERWVGAAVPIVIFACGYALTGARFTTPSGEPRSIALVQGAIPQTLKWDPEQLPGTLDLYARLTAASRGSDLIIWPEAAIPALYRQVAPAVEAVARDAAAAGSALLLGVLREHPPTGSFQNVLVAMTDPVSVYVKRHLVPFGEYYPVPDFVRGWLRLMNLPSTDAAPGESDQPPLAVAGERLGVTICYEDVFGAEQRHYLPTATLLVNVSNDGWFGDSIAPHQHLQIARLRAAEAGRYLLRATNTGISAIIEPGGAVVATLPPFEQGVLTGTVRGYSGLTPYARFGNLPVVLGALLVLAVQLAMTKFTIRPRT
jgi:apolipoprotein N-acyltransferase